MARVAVVVFDGRGGAFGRSGRPLIFSHAPPVVAYAGSLLARQEACQTGA